MDQPCDSHSVFQLRVLDRVRAPSKLRRPLSFYHALRAQYIGKHRAFNAFTRETTNVHRVDRAAAHRINIAEGICSSDLSVG